jgi:hypothetical protein
MRLPARREPVLPLCLWLCAATLAGCASPGVPKPPSLQLPEPVRDLSARRLGDDVELRFTLPHRSTDKTPLHTRTLRGVLCRELTPQSCVAAQGLSFPLSDTAQAEVIHDTLPADLATGAPRLLAYRVAFYSPGGRSAGWSDPAFTAAGAPPPPVKKLSAQGSRLGTVLSWQPVQPSDETVLLERSERKDSSETVTLDAHGMSTGAQGLSLDATVQPELAYRYVAIRQRSLTFGGHTVTIRSTPSAPIEFTLHLVYPPPTPEDLTAVGFLEGGNAASPANPPRFAVDLIWKPVDDAGLLAGLAGYNIYRRSLNAEGNSSGERVRLNAAPVPLPAFHDTSAQGSVRYRYEVTAVDSHGNESPAATTVLEP